MAKQVKSMSFSIFVTSTLYPKLIALELVDNDNSETNCFACLSIYNHLTQNHDIKSFH